MVTTKQENENTVKLLVQIKLDIRPISQSMQYKHI